MSKSITTTVHVHVLAIAATAAILAVGAGCSSKKKEPLVKPLSEGEQNRQLVQMAFSENVYNGIAAERAVYAKDFNPGTATLNELGRRRVNTLLHASRGARGRITIIRGEASDELYTGRVAAVRQEFASAGVNVEHINVVKGDHVEGGGIPSGQAILIFDKMLADYAAKVEAGGGGAAANASKMSQGSAESR
jgi:hypothetical protein